MMPDAEDPVLRGVRRLSVIEPDVARAERIRARCHAALARRRTPADDATGIRSPTGPGLAPALIAGLCLTYLLAIVHDLLRLHGRW